MRDEHRVHVPELAPGRLEHRPVSFEIIRIRRQCPDFLRSAHLQIRRQDLQLGGVAGDQEQLVAPGHAKSGEGLRDG